MCFFNQCEVFNRIRKLHCNIARGVEGLGSNAFVVTATNISSMLFNVNVWLCTVVTITLWQVVLSSGLWNVT